MESLLSMCVLSDVTMEGNPGAASVCAFPYQLQGQPGTPVACTKVSPLSYHYCREDDDDGVDDCDAAATAAAAADGRSM